MAGFGTSYGEQSSSTNTFIDTNLANFGLKSTNRVYSINLNETHVFSATVVNEFRAGYGRTSPIFLYDTTVPLGPRIRIRSDEVDRFGHWENGPQGRIQNTFQYGDTLTWIRGAHNFKFGGDFYRYQGNSYVDNRTRSEFIFKTWSDFAAGRPNEWQQRFGSTLRGHLTWLFGGFAQDDRRVTPTFTLNLGLRYEIYGPVSEVNDLISNIYLDCRESMGRAGTGPLGCIRTGQNAINANYYAQPRIGFAWNLRRSTVIRGGIRHGCGFQFPEPDH
jgi:outer membrane receptor protein involved in Fe transport